MKKIMILAISAILAVNLSAQEAKADKAECKKEKKERKFSQEERIERDIKVLSDELYMSEEQAAKFAATYREFIAAKIKLNKEFKKKFAKDLNDKQVNAVLHFKCRKAHKDGFRPDMAEFRGKNADFHGQKGDSRGKNENRKHRKANRSAGNSDNASDGNSGK